MEKGGREALQVLCENILQVLFLCVLVFLWNNFLSLCALRRRNDLLVTRRRKRERTPPRTKANSPLTSLSSLLSSPVSLHLENI